ncbi:MAG: TIR domain-containing protein, partial [Candidatus Electrothrix sp. AR5]|nr:TIR domain-containing protein [Candidatus Electrothrix sp. AR5]
MSYVNLDDQHEQGRLTRFRELLSGEVRMQTGEPFDIFQDRKDIAWGQQWQERINQSLDAVTFLIPIITPGFFKSDACREELERFLKREEKLGRGDLILPVYYVKCPVLQDKAKREHDRLAQVIAARQYADWRDLRFEEFTSPQLRKALAEMAEQIVEALERSEAEAPQQQSEKDSSTPISNNTFTNAGSGEQNIAQGHSPIGTQINNYYASPLQDAELRPNPAAKAEPPTLIVDPLYRCDYATITAALKAAEPGTRILVRPGLYEENIVIDKHVEIIGDGERSEIVIQLVGKPAILFRTDIGKVANLTLNDIRIEQGRLEIEDCDISSKGSICVQIHNDADPILRRCRIHDGPAAGVFICNNGKGLIEHNEIFANTQA